jgi:hypothetical protein
MVSPESDPKMGTDEEDVHPPQANASPVSSMREIHDP